MLRVTSTYKPPSVVVPAEATVEADSETTTLAVILIGLQALGENPQIVNHGIRGVKITGPAQRLAAGTYTVYADRD